MLAGCGLLALTFAYAWPVYILSFAAAGFGFGMGWTFANVATQDAVHPDRAGEASGVVLTIIVTAGGVGLAVGASVIAALHGSGTTLHGAIEDVLRTLAVGVVIAAGMTMAVRHQLVRRGLALPLSMKDG